MHIDMTHAICRKSEAFFANLLDKLDLHRAHLRQNPLPLFALPDQRDDLPAIEEMAAHLRQFKRVVFLGTGGAGLGGQVLAQLTGWGTPSHAAHKKTPILFFMDNLSTACLHDLLAPDALADTAFVVVSKSGGTAETMAQFSAALGAVEQAGLEPRAHFCVITQDNDNTLRRIATDLDLPTLPHDSKIGGRFSVLTNVGLLPAALAGLELTALRKGAAKALHEFLHADRLLENGAAAGAAIQIAHIKNSRTISVLMPYEQKLERFAFWYRQIWAESLGKDGRGTTPINALGTIDQHSQLQLYLDGPDDKFYTLITTPPDNRLAANSTASQSEALGWLHGRGLGELIAAQAEATYQALINNDRPARKIALDILNEESLGRLLMDFMLETILAAHLLDVNAFDQPAVEQGKIIAQKLMRDKQT